MAHPAAAWGCGSSPRARGTPAQLGAKVRRRRFIPAGAGNTWRRGRTRRGRSVHPRGRGEHGAAGLEGVADGGSSPRARGTPGSERDGALRARFIPAGAGNTTVMRSAMARSTVHPRGRGEHGEGQDADDHQDGSSPRARGTHAHHVDRARMSRFIPAGAGNTPLRCHQDTHSEVHPRGRGEHRNTCRLSQVPTGSSPRARGTLVEYFDDAVHTRFIPAGAGNTVRELFPKLTVTVHPRGRGEHGLAAGGGQTGSGSSPRARGTRSGFLGYSGHDRFIPAGAGNTGSWPRPCWPGPVHPRGRGEHRLSVATERTVVGSSPRARGTLNNAARTLELLRFIPAGAGNTDLYDLRSIAVAVHPRGRGEHSGDRGWVMSPRGSSPRARGTRRSRRRSRRGSRFIPAGAGNT